MTFLKRPHFEAKNSSIWAFLPSKLEKSICPLWLGETSNGKAAPEEPNAPLPYSRFEVGSGSLAQTHW